MGILSGVTTNPSIAAREGSDLTAVLQTITELLPGIPVFGQVTAVDMDGMMEEARRIHMAGRDIVVKIPVTDFSLEVIHCLKKEEIRTCATAVLTAAQGLLCALAGADYVAPYTGQNDWIGFRGIETLRELSELFHGKGIKTKILAASIEKPQEIVDFALAGADILTIPYHTFIQVFCGPMPLVQHYVDAFRKDWDAVGGRI